MDVKRATLLLPALAALLLAAGAAAAQPKPAPPRRLPTPAAVRGFIGGESHDSYAVRVRRGQTLTVRLSWRREGGNRAGFAVSESPDYYTAEPVKFGAWRDGGRRWVGRVPRGGDYYIDVVAHPSAHYTLRVSVK